MLWQVQEYLQTSGWLAVRSFAVHVLVSQDCKSPGDALRVVDQRNVVRSDFVLVSGDVVSNMALAPALAAHRARRKTDKQVLMTMVTKTVSTRQRLQRLGDPELVVALDHDTHQLLAYEEKPTSPQVRRTPPTTVFPSPAHWCRQGFRTSVCWPDRVWVVQ